MTRIASEILGIVWIVGLSLALPLRVQATEHPEPLPQYSDYTSLREDATLRSVAFATHKLGLACGDRGTILRTVDGGKSWKLISSGIDCPLSAVTWIDSKNAVIVGGNYDRITRLSRGVVLFSRDAGQSWQRSEDQELTRFHSLKKSSDGSLIARCDWSHAILTDRLLSRDGGRTWHDHSTFSGGFNAALPVDGKSGFAKPRNNQPDNKLAHQQHNTTSSPSLAELMQWHQVTKVPVAVRGACRITPNDYCIVGDHGVIMTTNDKGKTWATARGRNRRTSVLFVANSAKTVAWSMLGSEALEARNRVGLLVRAGQQDVSTESAHLALVNQTAAMLGAAGADMLDDSSMSIAEAASAWMSIHQPSVLVLEQALPAHIRDAFINAAAAAAVKRVAAYGFEGAGGTALHRDALLSHSGVLAGDLHADGMHYFAPNDIQLRSITLRYPYDISANRRRGSSVTDGISLPQGHRLTADPNNASRHQLQILKARLQQTDRLQKLVRNGADPTVFNESITRLLDQTAKVDQFRVAWSIVQATRPDKLPGGLALHEAALRQFATRFPSTSAGNWAALREQALRHSEEWKSIRSGLLQLYGKPETAAGTSTIPVSPFQNTEEKVRQVSNVSPPLLPKPAQQLNGNSGATDKTDAAVDLLWEFHPLVLFAREAARHRGDNDGLQVASETSPNLKRILDSQSPGWCTLLDKNQNTLLAKRAGSPPRLDGVLDDPCWESVNPRDHSSVRTRIAYDDNFIYIALQSHANNLRPDEVSSEDFGRDDNLDLSDRIHLQIDTDRDLMTARQLQISGSGRTHDAVDGNETWQPTWYLDIHRENKLVTIEIAMERRDITELPVTRGASWFISPQIRTSGEAYPIPVIPDPQHWLRVVFE